MTLLRRLSAPLFLAICLAGGSCRQADPVSEPDQGEQASQASPAAGSSVRVEVPKVEREGVWQPTAGGTQIPLWPANVPLVRPDSGDQPEATGNGSPTVGGQRWHWASYVTRPTMTIYRPEGRNTGAAMLVLPGGGFHAVATDLEGTEICDWVIEQGMTCVMLKYRTPQVWPRVNGRQQRPDVLLGLEDAQRAMGLLRAQAEQYRGTHLSADRRGGSTVTAARLCDRRLYGPGPGHGQTAQRTGAGTLGDDQPDRAADLDHPCHGRPCR